MDTYSQPTPEQIEKLQSLPPDQPLAALNLFRFNPKAQYAPGDPEHGTAGADVSGEEAYQRYGALAGPAISALGGRVVFSTGVDQVFIGAGADWDTAAIMWFPNRAAFVEMLSIPDFQHASRHRKAALADHCMLHLDGSIFASE